jgi:uncharacterized repeat protein (TIGR01451 family)
MQRRKQMRSKTNMFNVIAVIAVVLLSLVSSPNSIAQALSCGINEVTFTTNTGFNDPTISDDGKLVAFAGTSDLVGQNPDQSLEIFLFDSSTGVTTQLTNSVGTSNYEPFISGDGTKVAFVSNRNDGGNPDGSSEIFLMNLQSSTITQLTFGTIGNEIESIDKTGSNISLHSWDNYTGGNPDNNLEIFVYKVATNQFTQVTSSTGNGFLNGGSKLDGNGTHLIFGSFLNLAGVDPGFRYRVFSKDLTSGTLKQISEIGTESIPGDISDDGNHYFFFSSAYAIANPEHNFELFVFNATTGGTQLLTDTGTGEYNSYPRVSNDGARISFLSTHDWTGGNPDHNSEIYLMDLNTGAKTQVTNTEGGEIAPPSMSGNGKKIAFQSNLFPELGNADSSSEVFLAECLPPPSADVSVGMGIDVLNPKQGDKITYTVTVTNFGPNAAQNVVLNDLLSSGSTFVNAQANKGTFSTPPAGQSGTVSWSIGNMATNSQESAQIKVTVIFRGKGTITNTASVSSLTDDPNLSNNGASLTVSVGSGGKK